MCVSINTLPMQRFDPDFLCNCKVSFNNFDMPEQAFREILLHDQVSNKFLAHGGKPP